MGLAFLNYGVPKNDSPILTDEWQRPKNGSQCGHLVVFYRDLTGGRHLYTPVFQPVLDCPSIFVRDSPK